MTFPLGPFPASERLRFRIPRSSDARFYRNLMTEPDYIRFIADYGIESTEDAVSYIKSKSLARFAAQGVGLWLVELKETREPIGVCGLVVRKELKFPDLGFAFLSGYRGQGYGREAGRAVLDFATRELKLRTLCAIAHPDNKRSANLLTKLGFEAKGQRHLAEIGSTADYFVWKLRYVEAGLS